MKNRSFFAGILSAVAILTIGASAQASTINLGTLVLGATNVAVPGALSLSSGHLIDTITGTLPKDSEITFSYTFNTDITKTTFSAGRISPPTSATIADTTFNHQLFAGTPFGFISANMSPTSTKTWVVNMTSASLAFTSTLNVILSAIHCKDPTGYLTYTISSVPLPASLPMFGAVIAGLFGLGWMGRRQQKASFATA